MKPALLTTPLSPAVLDTIHALAHTTPVIRALRYKQVIKWHFGDLAYLHPPTSIKEPKPGRQTNKVAEDSWGRRILKAVRPELVANKQWTGPFGEHVAKELLILSGRTVTTPAKKKDYQLDLETEDALWEVKTGTYFTDGTAHEKIYGVAVKYAEVPGLYGKPVKILCIGGAEKAAREKLGVLPGPAWNEERQKILDCFRGAGFEFVGATDLIKKIAADVASAATSADDSTIEVNAAVDAAADAAIDVAYDS